MATQENPQLPNAAELTPEQIAEGIAAQQTGGESPDIQREYVFETETGSVFRGKTKQEVIDKMLKSTDHANKTIKQQRDELEQYKAQLEQQAPYIQQQQQQQQQEQFDPNRYYQTWAQDPMAAEAALIDRMLQQRFGITLDEFAQQTQHAYQFSSRLEPEVIARAWQATSDFPDDPNNPELLEKASAGLEQVWNEFFPNDYQVTPQKLEMAHAVAVKRGLYQPKGAVPPQNAEPQMAQSNPMPTLNTGTSGGTGQQQDIRYMSPEELRMRIEQGQFSR